MLQNFSNLINKLSDIIGDGLSGLFMTLAFLAFLAAVINFILKRRQGDAGGLEQAKNMLGWSVVALFVMVSIWGIVNFIAVNLLGNDASKTDVDKPRTNFGANSSQGGSNKNQSGTSNTYYSNEGRNYPNPIVNNPSYSNEGQNSSRSTTETFYSNEGRNYQNTTIDTSNYSNEGRNNQQPTVDYSNVNGLDEDIRCAQYKGNIRAYDQCMSGESSDAINYSNEGNNYTQPKVEEIYSNEGRNSASPQEPAPTSSYLDDLW